MLLRYRNINGFRSNGAGVGLLPRRMIRTALAGLALCLAWALPARAQTATEGELVPNRAFFAGLGPSYNAVNFGTQNIYAIGTSDNYEDGTLVSYGTAAGPGTVSLSSPSTASPLLELGYFQHFSDSAWLWGAKFSYSDLRASATSADVSIPQYGSFTYTGSHAVVPFTGDAVVNSYETEVNSRFAFMPFIGRSFGKGFVYLGAGGTMSEVQTSLNGLVGYAVINGVNTNVSGAPQNFASSGFVLGAGLVVGGTYFLGQGWFVDVDYSFAKTAAQIGRYQSNFVNSSTTPGVTTVGTLVGQSSETVVTNSVTITIDKSFW
jgi:hypothetical protein